MHGRQKLAFALFAGLTLLIDGTSECVAGPYQPHANFEAAVRDSSTSPYVVLLTAIDDRTGEARTGCTTADLLKGAIWMQTWAHSGQQTRAEDKLRSEEVRRILIRNTAHVFHFSDPGALRNTFPFPISERYPQACDAISRGVRVRIADLTGQPIFEPPTAGSQRRRAK